MTLTVIGRVVRMMHDEVSDTENIRKNLAIERMIVEGCDILLDTSQTFVRQGELPPCLSLPLCSISFHSPLTVSSARLSHPAAVQQRAGHAQQGPPGLPVTEEGRRATVFSVHQTHPHLYPNIWRKASLAQGRPHLFTNIYPSTLELITILTSLDKFNLCKYNKHNKTSIKGRT